MPGKFTGVSSNAMVGTDTGGITNLNLTGNFPVTPSSPNADSMAGTLGQVGSGASNLTGTLGNVSDLDVTGINRGLSTLTTSVTPTKIADTAAAAADKQMSVTDLTKIGASMVGAASAGSVVNNATKTTTTPTTPTTPTLSKATYKNAPIKGFRMQKLKNATGHTVYVPFVNDTSLLPVPQGYKPI
jgi:septal ring-binding cell division protein DamX